MTSCSAKRNVLPVRTSWLARMSSVASSPFAAQRDACSSLTTDVFSGSARAVGACTVQRQCRHFACPSHLREKTCMYMQLQLVCHCKKDFTKRLLQMLTSHVGHV